ncbi:hypothetical protein KUCAC02_011601, partial [Chaenocephalus aceratus]
GVFSLPAPHMVDGWEVFSKMELSLVLILPVCTFLQAHTSRDLTTDSPLSLDHIQVHLPRQGGSNGAPWPGLCALL